MPNFLLPNLITGSTAVARTPLQPKPQLWDLKTGLSLNKFQGHTDGVTFVMPGPDGHVLTASEDRTLRVWDVDTGDCLRTIRSHSGSVTSLCMAGPDRIVTGSSDKKLRVFDVSGHLCGETELDSEILAVASPPPPVPRRRRGRGGGGGSRGSGGGRKGDADQFLRTGSVATPPVVRVLACGGTYIPTPTKPMLRSVDVQTEPTEGAVVEDDALASPDKSNLCAGRSEGDDEDDREAAKEAGMMTCVAISAAGAKGRGILVTGSYDKGVRVMHNVLSSDRDSNQRSSPKKGVAAPPPPPPVTMRLLGRHGDGVRSVAISADGRWVVSGDREGRVKVWEVPQEAPPGTNVLLCKAEAEFEAHKGYVYALCMSPDARTVVSGGSDKAFRVWDLSLVVYARRMVLNRMRALWTTGRLRRPRQKRHSSSSRRFSVSPRRSSGGKGGKGGVQVLKAFDGSREQRQQILESLFALPEIIYAKVLMYV